MAGNITRRQALMTGAVTTGAMGTMFGSAPQTVKAEPLPDVWGEDFMTQWSPPANVKRDLTPGPTPIRLSCAMYTLNNSPGWGGRQMTPLPDQVKAVHDNGYTAVESGSLNWANTPDSTIREMRAALDEYDVMFYTLHQWQNIIDPDQTRVDANIRGIITGIESAERIGVPNIVLHTGGRNPQNKDRPHAENWTRETWELSVAATKRILRDTAGSTVNLCFEAVNCCNNNTPQSHVRLKEDVGDPRIKVCLDPTNMMHPGVFFRTTELLNLCFDLLGEDIMLCHAKDSTWDSMSTAINEGAALGQGNLDYHQYLARMSHMKKPRALLIEHMPMESYAPSRQHLFDTAVEIGVTIYG